MQANYRFFSNNSCQYFPCHSDAPDRFNCLFCYCPLYLIPECGGNPRYPKNNVKDCSACLRPHLPEEYDNILTMLRHHLKHCKFEHIVKH